MANTQQLLPVFLLQGLLHLRLETLIGEFVGHRAYIESNLVKTLLNMNYRELYSLRIIGAIGSIIVAAIIAVVVLLSHCRQGFVC